MKRGVVVIILLSTIVLLAQKKPTGSSQNGVSYETHERGKKV